MSSLADQRNQDKIAWKTRQVFASLNHGKEAEMTERAMKFVQAWIDQNLNREPSSDHLEDADTLTQQCLDAANKEGIRSDEISEEIGDLRSFIKEALEMTADEEGDDEETL
jgi:hypothetical protein